ncbi:MULTISPECIES: peptidoglycan recognition protein [unclassified Streptomyces]|uniref:peptidoglycan recognition protein family protein n=1 Tax=unclassified Streptomyces TaxID=2593676 RepID=UPI0016620A18|nr:MULTISPECIES: peptidoglycan recognition protein [unclassified Streptomyces]MBD0840925.1 peptidoglycan recognition protein [Streptomyces sp. TRM68416]
MSSISGMRGFLASSIGATCAAALALPLTPPAAAATTRAVPTAEAATTAAPHTGPDLAGSTQSLPLAPLPGTRSRGSTAPAEPAEPPDQGLPRRDVHRFSLVGVVWDDPDTELHGTVQVRTRSVETGAWSGWQDIETHNGEHAADPDTTERASGRVRGSTAPLWVGDSDGVEVRVRAEPPTHHAGHQPPHDATHHPGHQVDHDADHRVDETGRGTRTLPATPVLPTGLRLELVDPGGPEPAVRPAPLTRGTRADAPAGTALTAEVTAASAANAELAPLGALEIPELGAAETRKELLALRADELTAEQQTKPYIGPRPRIVTRRGWGADEKWREKKFVYTSKVKAAFVHHTASGNGYKCAQAPSVIRGIYRYHVMSMGWRDVGYNFLVDKCGNIYEGRAGGVAKPVLGAHTLGFNTNSMGIALLGSYGKTKPSAAAVEAVSRLTAWKLGLFGANPRGKTYLKSGGGNLYQKGKNVRLNVISGHRDGYATECPGKQLYGKLDDTRSTAADFQGR